MKIGIIAGESSGDFLGAGLIQALRKRYPDAIIEGIGGAEMEKVGCRSLFPMERLSVMGYIEPLFRLKELLHIRKSIKHYFLKNPPDVFIGIDAPDFNLHIETVLKTAGIPTVHYVSPSIWAWRSGRIHKIKKAADLILCILPFEPAIYEAEKIDAIFVGHPLAEEIPFYSDKQAAREKIACQFVEMRFIASGCCSVKSNDERSPILAVLPGSRAGEIKQLGELFLKVVQQCQINIPDLQIVIPMVNEAREQQFNKILDKYKLKNIHLIRGNSRETMAAADVILLASGTATLEAMLVKRPMVVAYKLSRLMYWIGKRLVKIKYFSFPNILNQREIVPEFIQDNASVENITNAVLKQFSADSSALIQNFQHWHEVLKQNASEKAAEAVLKLLAAS
jgi:lipid-A-disaccharide synthase